MTAPDDARAAQARYLAAPAGDIPTQVQGMVDLFTLVRELQEQIDRLRAQDAAIQQAMDSLRIEWKDEREMWL